MNSKNGKIINTFIFFAAVFFLCFGLFSILNLRHDRSRSGKGDEHWFKGNLHVHTNRADGDSSPQEVINWYLDHGYDFLAITDHDLRFTKQGFRRKWARRILILSGEEITIGERAEQSIHMGAVHTQYAVPADLGKPDKKRLEYFRQQLLAQGSAPAALEASVRGFKILSQLKALIPEIEGQGAIAILNHPAMSLGFPLFMQLEELPPFIELWNPHESKLYANGQQPPDTEIMWDAALSTGKKIYAVTGDDAHHFKKTKNSPPGGVWLWIKAHKLSPEALIAALKRGDSYVSTGIVLKRVEWEKSQKQIVVEVDAKPGRSYSIRFIGKEGAVLQQTDASQAVYPVKGDELYVRVKVIDNTGLKACAQPFFISREAGSAPAQ